MKRAETYKAKFAAQSQELKDLRTQMQAQLEVAGRLRDQVQWLEADNQTLRYENGRQRFRVDAMEYALVLAQAHAAPLQRLKYDSDSRVQSASTASPEAQTKSVFWNRDQTKLAG